MLVLGRTRRVKRLTSLIKQASSLTLLPTSYKQAKFHSCIVMAFAAGNRNEVYVLGRLVIKVEINSVTMLLTGPSLARLGS